MRNWILVVLLAFAGVLNAQDRTHKVQPGETLYGISRMYNVTIEQLKAQNPMLDEGAILQEGMDLVIPESNVVSTSTQSTSTRDTAHYDFYTVQPQQTIYSLTREWNVSYEQLLEWNPILSDGLKVGQILQLPKGTLAPETKAGYSPYQVQPMETVYSLLRKFEIEEEQFYEANPEVRENGLKAGQSIWVPSEQVESTSNPSERVHEDETRVEEDSTVQEERLSKYIVIKTTSGETWETLRAKYGVSQDELLRLNPELVSGVRPHRNLIVPRPVSASTNGSRSELDNRFVALNNQSLKVAVVLPLFLEENDSLVQMYQMGEASPQVVPQSRIAFDFYTGLKMAMDSLTSYGLNIDFSVYDTRNSPGAILSIAEDLKRTKPDLVFGPLYSSNAELLSKELPNQWIVTPLSRTVNIEGLNHLIQAVSPIEAEHLQLADWVNKNALEANLIFVRRDNESEEHAVLNFIQHLQASEARTVSTLVMGEELITSGAIRSRLAAGRTDVFIALDTDPVLLTSFINGVVTVNDTDIVVLSSSRLMGARTLEVEKLNRLNLYLSDVEYVDYADTNTQSFIQHYRTVYNNEPPRFTYHGFDVGMYFIPSFVMGAIQNEGQSAPFWYQQDGVMKNHDFQSDDSQYPNENGGTFMLHLEDFTWKRVF